MKKFLALLLAVCMLASMVVIPAGAAEIKDVTDDHWAKAHVDRWVGNGVMTVDGDGNFNPEQELTRAEFAIILCRLMGYTEKADASTFVDLPEDQAAADAILKLKAAGVMNGVGDNRAAPNSKLTREHVAVMVFRAMNLKPVANSSMSFTDAKDVSDWAKAEMATMASLKMVEGVGENTLVPQHLINNGQMAALLDKMVAAYVTKDGETVDLSKDGITNPQGVVIIRADNVKIADAAGSAAVVVTEDAPKNVTVTVTGSASDITLAKEGAKITVAKDAKVDSITADAPRANVTVNGTVGDVTVAKDAENAKVTVAKGAEAASVSVEAPKAAVEVSGAVGDVDVAEGADNTTITAKSGAKVENVNTSAEGVKVSGAKDTIGTVVTEKGSADVAAKGATVKNEGAETKVDGKTLAEGEEKTSNKTGSGTGSSTGTGTLPPPAPTTYDVTISSGITNGTVAADKETAEAGETVTLTVKPADGYELDTLTVTDAENNAVEVSENKTFTMPESDVTVTATFRAVTPPTPTEYNITSNVTPANSGTVKFTVGGNEVTKATKDAVVTVIATPAAGYEAGTITVKAGETAVTLSENNTFSMPESDVTVTVTFTQTTTPVTIKVVPANLTGFTAEKPQGTNADTYTVAFNATTKTQIDLSATGLKKHANSADTQAYWVGVGLTHQEGAKYAWGYDGKPNNLTDADYGDPTDHQTNGTEQYDTLYWGAPSASNASFWNTKKSGYVSVKVGNVVTDYTVKFDVTVATHKLNIVQGAQTGAQVSDITSITVNGAAPTSGQSTVAENSQVEVIVASKRQIAVGLMYTGATVEPKAEYTTKADGNFAVKITFTMPEVDADLCIVVLEACTSASANTVGVQLSACDSGDSTAQGNLMDKLKPAVPTPEKGK